mmetsp:Transcript_34460/g.85390  ORF Transcript_34460/g.85390 Transcript_34460/m.85390 type:complete len:216 (-) Transcript_34460:1357-2004(-)
MLPFAAMSVLQTRAPHTWVHPFCAVYVQRKTCRTIGANPAPLIAPLSLSLRWPAGRPLCRHHLLADECGCARVPLIWAALPSDGGLRGADLQARVNADQEIIGRLVPTENEDRPIPLHTCAVDRPLVRFAAALPLAPWLPHDVLGELVLLGRWNDEVIWEREVGAQTKVEPVHEIPVDQNDDDIREGRVHVLVTFGRRVGITQIDAEVRQRIAVC